MTLSVLDIIEGTSVDGPGLRTAIYFSGCNHHCEGCHNRKSWDIEAGKQVSIDDIMKIVAYNDFNVTFSGGDPFFQHDNVQILAQRIRNELHTTIWCYTGYVWEDIVNDNSLNGLLNFIDVLVDGPFLINLRNTSLRFRGSSNQRIIDVNGSLASGSVKLWCDCDFSTLP